ncbi:hypothetical protein ACQ4PT_029280 [Festuca glaucescens]
MEATAVSLTRTVLDGVLGSAGTAMVDEAALLLGVRREVDFIRSELQMMQSFLRVQSSAGAACKDTVKTCVKQVRDLACDLEDCLLDFTLHASRARWLRWGPGIVARHHASPAASGSSRPASWSSTSATSGEFSVTTPERIEKLRNLQVLGVVRIAQGSEAARNLGKLTSLRRLGVDVAASQEVWMDLCRSIASLVRLERLEVRSESLEFLKDTKESPPKHLTSLRLCGRLGKLPEWMGALNDLGKVKLLRTQLKQIDIEVIGNLPNLTLLALWEESFAEGSLCFSEGTFQKLKLLYIEGLENIETIKIEEGTLPVLEKLEVKKCISLHDSELGLSRVKFLENLNELVLTSCGDKPQLEKALQRQISGFELAKRPKLITGKSIVTRS